ncbi:MAG: DUF2617 family protein [Phycisphaerales bacterium]|nr:DUF2617 family protein [Phycisphaerales bacterium]
MPNLAKQPEVGPVLPSSNDLNLFVYDRPLHPELFQRFGAWRVSQGAYHADVWILPLGHLVTITLGHHSLTELVALENEILPTRGVLTRFKMKGERDVEREANETWQYMSSTQVENMDDALYKAVHHDLLAHAGKRGWLVTHEKWADGDLVPFSYVDVEARDREFHVHAFHAYPHERTIVKTQTIFELPENAK